MQAQVTFNIPIALVNSSSKFKGSTRGSVTAHAYVAWQNSRKTNSPNLQIEVGNLITNLIWHREAHHDRRMHDTIATAAPNNPLNFSQNSRIWNTIHEDMYRCILICCIDKYIAIARGIRCRGAHIMPHESAAGKFILPQSQLGDLERSTCCCHARHE